MIKNINKINKNFGKTRPANPNFKNKIAITGLDSVDPSKNDILVKIISKILRINITENNSQI
jgi:hypothetical protein